MIKPQLNEFGLGLKIGDTEEQLDQKEQRPRCERVVPGIGSILVILARDRKSTRLNSSH